MVFLRHEKKFRCIYSTYIIKCIVCYFIIYIYRLGFLSFFPVLDKLDKLDVLDMLEIDAVFAAISRRIGQLIFVCAFHRSCCCYTQVTKNK